MLGKLFSDHSSEDCVLQFPPMIYRTTRVVRCETIDLAHSSFLGAAGESLSRTRERMWKAKGGNAPGRPQRQLRRRRSSDGGVTARGVPSFPCIRCVNSYNIAKVCESMRLSRNSEPRFACIREAVRAMSCGVTLEVSRALATSRRVAQSRLTKRAVVPAAQPHGALCFSREPALEPHSLHYTIYSMGLACVAERGAVGSASDSFESLSKMRKIMETLLRVQRAEDFVLLTRTSSEALSEAECEIDSKLIIFSKLWKKLEK